MKNKSMYMKQILNEWNKFKHKNSLNEICLTKNETKLLIQLIENKNNLNESILDSLKKFPEFLKKINTLKDKLNSACLEKIVSFLKSKIKKITNVKILFLASSIALVVGYGYNSNFTKIKQETIDNIQITTQSNEIKSVDCGHKNLCFITIEENGQLSITKSDLSQYEIEDNLIIKGEKSTSDNDQYIDFSELNKQFEEFAKEKQIESGVLFWQPEIEQQLKKILEKDIKKISSGDQPEFFNNVLKNNDNEYYLTTAYIPNKNSELFRQTVEKLFELYEQKLKDNNVDYKQDELIKQKNDFLNKEITDGLGGFTVRYENKKNDKIFPLPQIVFMTDIFDIDVILRHEIMHSVSDFKKISDLYKDLYVEMYIQQNKKSFNLDEFYKNVIEIQIKNTNTGSFKQKDINKFKDSLNISLKYFIGLGLIKKETDTTGQYRFYFVPQKRHGDLYYGRPNENARHLFDLQKVISNNTTHKTFNIIEHIFKNMYDISYVTDYIFAKNILENYIKNIDELGPMINSENEFNKKYLKGTDFYNKDINEDFHDNQIKFLLYLNKLSKKEAESVKIAIKKLDEEIDVHMNNMASQSFKDDNEVIYNNYKQSFSNLLTKAFSLAQLYNNSIK